MSILLFSYLSFLVLGAIIFQALEEDFEVDRRQLAVKLKSDFLKHRANKTKQEVEMFVQVRDEDPVHLRVRRLLSTQRSHLM